MPNRLKSAWPTSLSFHERVEEDARELPREENGRRLPPDERRHRAIVSAGPDLKRARGLVSGQIGHRSETTSLIA